jgi:hypothetical protein
MRLRRESRRSDDADAGVVVRDGRGLSLRSESGSVTDGW